MTYKTSADLMADAGKFYNAQQYLEAADLLETHWQNFERDKVILIHWLMCVNALGGEQARAIDYFQQLINEGFWFPPGYIDDSDFDSLREMDEFKRLTTISLERYEIAQADAKPDLFVQAPSDDPLPVIIACHGNRSNIELTYPYWKTVPENGWMLALPQSSQIADQATYIWTDLERGTAEVKAHYQTLLERGIQENRVIIGGFSMGGQLALHVAVNRLIPVHGVLMVAAGLPSEVESFDLSKLPPDISFYIIVGELETNLVTLTHQLAERLMANGNRVCVDQRPNLAHEYPADFADTVQKAIAFIEG